MNKYYKNMPDVKISADLSKVKHRCVCGHSVIFPANKDKEWMMCGWCGHRIYRDADRQAKWDAKCKMENFRYQFSQYLKAFKVSVK